MCETSSRKIQTKGSKWSVEVLSFEVKMKYSPNVHLDTDTLNYVLLFSESDFLQNELDLAIRL
jgi:hypothetical protein